MKSTTLKILGEEFSKIGVDLSEEVLEEVVETMFERVLPRVVLEEENTAVKSVAGVMVTLYPSLKPLINKATDLNRDGE